MTEHLLSGHPGLIFKILRFCLCCLDQARIVSRNNHSLHHSGNDLNLVRLEV